MPAKFTGLSVNWRDLIPDIFDKLFKTKEFNKAGTGRMPVFCALVYETIGHKWVCINLLQKWNDKKKPYHLRKYMRMKKEPDR